MKKLILAAVAALGIASSPALAQIDGDFSGFKGAALTGYDNTDFGKVYIGSDRFDLKNAQGLIYGATLGYDRQSGRFVYGVELEATDSAADVNDPFLGEIKLGREFYAGGRIGFVVDKHLMIYGKGGYADTRLRTVGFQSVGLDGFKLGGGVEYKFSDKVFARGEYRYSELDRGLKRNQGLAAVGLRF